MQKDRILNLLHLHFIVFIWGFTAILGKLITIDSLPLVWIRMGLATLFISIYIYYAKFSLKVSKKTFFWLLGGGIVVALHWVTFFLAIKVSTVSVALAMMSTGAFFTALMEPFWYGRKVIGYEIAFGLLVIAGLYLIFKVETQYVTLVTLPTTDWVYLLILAIVCTAYAFIASVKIMRILTPYTVMLTTNLEPVYGILLAWFIFGSEEKMKPMFYVGALIILTTVIANGILKQRENIKKRVPKI